MSNAIQSFGVIHNNPFILAPLFPAFYGSLPAKPKSLLLSYLVLPLVLYPISRKFLVNANSRSSVRTLINDRERLFGLGERLVDYRELTNTCIQHLIDGGSVLVGDDLSISVFASHHSDGFCPHDTDKAARRLGVLFAPFDIPTIYRMLGVKKL